MNHYYDEIVVGSSLRAVLFAAKHQLPIYFSKADRPHQFDMLSPDQDLSCFHLVNETKVWEGHGFSETWGTRKEILWERLIFLHSLKGLVPFSDFCESIRITDNTLTGFSEYAKLHSVDFGRCFYFDPQNIYQLLPESTKTDIGLFLDFGNVWHVDYTNNIDSNKIRSSTGINTSWLSPVGPMSFIFSKNISKAKTDVTEGFNFRLGTTF